MYTPSDTRGGVFRQGWTLAFLLTATLVALATLPPLVGPGGRVLVMQAFSNACHQIVERSPAIAGVPLAVCHRCYGTYWGLFAGTALLLGLGSWRPYLNLHAARILALAVLPAATDWGLGFTHLWSNTPVSRTVTGSIMGAVVGLYLALALSRPAEK